ncbi:TPA: hypothetical protein DCZ32_01395, partial [Candidatus Uhrbacteria bacterium]|nr:hypothetical protein [Candidatus Uhrbacteria bacterium]
MELSDKIKNTFKMPHRKIKIINNVIVLAIVIFTIAFTLSLAGTTTAISPAPVDLLSANGFAILAGAGITNTGSTTITGDVGSYATVTQTGFGSVTLNGTNHFGDATTQSAKTDLTTAYNDAEARTPTVIYGAIHDLGGEILTPGVYNDPSSFAITGTLTLDGENDPDAVFIFQAGSTLTTAGSSVVNLINGAQARNVFWQVGSSATLGTNSAFKGNILALTSVTITTGANIEGRILAQNGTVTLDANTITVPTTLYVNKTVVNDNGGTKIVSDFPLFIDGIGVTSEVANTVSPGLHTVSETVDPGYTVTINGDCAANGTITLIAGDVKTCTITNDD